MVVRYRRLVVSTTALEGGSAEIVRAVSDSGRDPSRPFVAE